jgi:hypothetical protein
MALKDAFASVPQALQGDIQFQDPRGHGAA